MLQLNKAENNQRVKAIIALLICAALWSIGGLCIKLVNLNPITIAGGRSIIAALVIIVLNGKPKFSFSKWQISGAVMYMGTVMLFVFSNKLTTSANAILLQYTAPIYAALLGWLLLKEKVFLRDWIAIGIVLGGMVLFFIGDISGGSLTGNILAVISGVTFASQAVFIKLEKKSTPADTIVLGNILTFITSLPFMLQERPTFIDVGVLATMGIFQLGVAYSLYAYAINKVTALEAILIPVIEPILNPLWVLIFLGEIPGKWSIIGGAIVISAVTVRCILAQRASNKNEGTITEIVA